MSMSRCYVISSKHLRKQLLMIASIFTVQCCDTVVLRSSCQKQLSVTNNVWLSCEVSLQYQDTNFRCKDCQDSPCSHCSHSASCMVDNNIPSGRSCTNTDHKALHAAVSLLGITIHVDSVIIGLLYMAYPGGCQHNSTSLPKLRLYPMRGP